MQYISKQNPDEVFEAKKVKEDTKIEHPDYGQILVTAGNYTLTRLSEPKKGTTVGITEIDLEAQYEPKVKRKNK